MDPLRLALFTGLIPAAVAAGTLLLTRRFGVGIALAAGYVAGHLGVTGIPKGMPTEKWQWLLPIAILAGTAELRTCRRSAAPALLSLAVTAAAGSAALLLSGTMLIARLCGAFAASAGACLLLSKGHPVRVPAAAILLPAFWWIGFRYADLPAPAAILLAAGPAAAWAAEFAPLDRLKPWQSWTLRAAASALPAGIAVAIAFARSPSLDY